jgi:thienamycin biosynthesis protein ThnO
MELIEIPSREGGEPSFSGTATTLTGCDGSPVARVDQASRLLQQRMARLAREAVPGLRDIDDGTWFGYFAQAGRSVAASLDEGGLAAHIAGLSRACGLPARRAARGIRAVAAQITGMDQILAAQSPDGTIAPYRTGNPGRAGWSWLPAGRTAMVRVPANFPTIVIEWLQVLAARRGTLVSTSRADPFTTEMFAAALHEAGLPSGAVSVCHDQSATFHRLADQVIWPGEQPAADIDPMRLKLYHFGRSKAILARPPDDDAWDRLTRLAFQGCGRLCTNVSSVLTAHGAQAAAESLAARFAKFPVLPLDDAQANVPAFPDHAGRDAVARLIEREIAAGATDITARLTDVPLRADLDGAAFLRPTVLLVPEDCELIQMELPFPFVTVAEVPRSRLAHVGRSSLIMSLVGDDPGLLAELTAEPTITKVFHGDKFDRGYDPVDPQEGYLADFLFQKKPVLS